MTPIRDGGGALPPASPKPPRAGQRATLALAMAIASALPAQALDIRAGIDTEHLYNSNFFGAPTGGESASSIQLGPHLRLDGSGGDRFRYDIRYAGLVQQFLDQDDVNAVEHRVRARWRYAVSPRTQIILTERFRDISNLRFSRLDIEVGDSALDPNQNRYRRNDFEAELQHRLRRRLNLEASLTHQLLAFVDTEDRNDSNSIIGRVGLDYAWSRRHAVGGSITATRQQFDGTSLRTASVGNYFDASIDWQWALSRGLSLSAGVGPAWIRASEDALDPVRQPLFVGEQVGDQILRANFASCAVDDLLGVPVASLCSLADGGVTAEDLGEDVVFTAVPGPRAGDSSRVNVFTSVQLQGSWEDWDVNARYRRRPSTTAGDALVSVLDRFAVEVERHPRGSRWSQVLAASWDRRASLTEATLVDFTVVPGPQGEAQRDGVLSRLDAREDQLRALTAIVGVRNQFSKRLSGALELRYRRTRQPSAPLGELTAERYLISLAFTYEFLGLQR